LSPPKFCLQENEELENEELKEVLQAK